MNVFQLSAKPVTMLGMMLCLLVTTACQQSNNSPSTNQSNAQTSNQTNAQASQTASTVASSTVNTQNLQLAKADDPLTKLLAMTLNNGFLLALRSHQTLNIEQKRCMADYDKGQMIVIAQKLLDTHLSADDIKEANDFYQLPIGQKLIRFNEQQSDVLQDVSGKTALKEADFSSDEQLQFGAFLQTNAGQKIGLIANTQLQPAVEPIVKSQLQKCQIADNQFYPQVEPVINASAPTTSVASTAK